jgi:hypothetical protein
MLRCILAALAAFVLLTASLIPDDAYARGRAGYRGGGGVHGGVYRLKQTKEARFRSKCTGPGRPLEIVSLTFGASDGLAYRHAPRNSGLPKSGRMLVQGIERPLIAATTEPLQVATRPSVGFCNVRSTSVCIVTAAYRQRKLDPLFTDYRASPLYRSVRM